MQMADLLNEKIFKYTVSVTAGRGRGKSATVGLVCAIAI